MLNLGIGPRSPCWLSPALTTPPHSSLKMVYAVRLPSPPFAPPSPFLLRFPSSLALSPPSEESAAPGLEQPARAQFVWARLLGYCLRRHLGLLQEARELTEATCPPFLIDKGSEVTAVAFPAAAPALVFRLQVLNRPVPVCVVGRARGRRTHEATETALRTPVFIYPLNLMVVLQLPNFFPSFSVSLSNPSPSLAPCPSHDPLMVVGEERGLGSIPRASG